MQLMNRLYQAFSTAAPGMLTLLSDNNMYRTDQDHGAKEFNNDMSSLISLQLERTANPNKASTWTVPKIRFNVKDPFDITTCTLVLRSAKLTF